MTEEQIHAEEDRLIALHALNLLDTPPEDRFDRVTALCQRLFGVPTAAVTLIDHDRQFTKSAAGYEPERVERADAFCNVTIQDSDMLIVEDATLDSRFADLPSVRDDDDPIRFYAGQPLVTPGGHRVGALCIFDSAPRSLSLGDQGLLRDLALWVQKEMVIDEELERAGEVQRGLLPQTQPELAGWDVAGRCIPTAEVGGDLFDWYATPDGLVVTLADVMGKGMPAAIMVATLRAILRATSRSGDLATAAAVANESMDADFSGTGAFATMFHALIRPQDEQVHYVDAGHGLAFVRRSDGSTERVAGGGPPLGPVPGMGWDLLDVELAPGDALGVVSDGILDEHVGLDDLGETMSQALSAPTAAEAVEQLLGRIAGRRAGDDCAAVVLRRTR